MFQLVILWLCNRLTSALHTFLSKLRSGKKTIHERTLIPLSSVHVPLWTAARIDGLPCCSVRTSLGASGIPENRKKLSFENTNVVRGVHWPDRPFDAHYTTLADRSLYHETVSIQRSIKLLRLFLSIVLIIVKAIRPAQIKLLHVSKH